MNYEYTGSFQTDSGASNTYPIKGKSLYDVVKETMQFAQSECLLNDSYDWKVASITDNGSEPLFWGTGCIDSKGILHDSGCVYVSNPHIRISKKMLKGISRVEKRYGLLDKLFFIDRDESNRHGQGFADGCELEKESMPGFCRCIRFDGTIL